MKSPEDLRTLQYAGISTACPAEGSASSAFQIEITQIFLVQEGTAAAVSSKTAFLPVDFVSQAVPEWPSDFPVFSERGRIDLNLPPCTACGRTV